MSLWGNKCEFFSYSTIVWRDPCDNFGIKIGNKKHMKCVDKLSQGSEVGLQTRQNQHIQINL